MNYYAMREKETLNMINQQKEKIALKREEKKKQAESREIARTD